MFHNKNTDKDWEKIGESDPYYGVLTVEKFHLVKNNDERIKDFWLSGEVYVEEIMKIVRENVFAEFKPRKILDFGCGVGRVLIPLSKIGERCTGVDVSQAMLNEARSNCAYFGVDNVDFIKSGDELNEIESKYDFIHSFIVFQHIPVKRGENILKKLLTHLEENGIGVIHLTYHRSATVLSNKIYSMIKDSEALSGLWNLIHGQPYGKPVLQMNSYNLNKIFRYLQEANCHNLNVRFTNHGDKYLGVILIFQKQKLLINGVE